MRVAIYGAGGVGAYVGGRLQAGGHDVVFIARGRHLEALRSAGLNIKSAQGDVALPKVSATDDPASVGPVDVVLLGVKLYDLESAARALQPLLGADSMVVPVQNGVDAADRLAAVLSPAQVVKGAVYIVSFLTGPGQVEHRSPFCKLVLAELDNRQSQRTTDFADALNRSGVEARVSADIDADLWRKFVMLAPFAAVACLARATVGEVLAHGPTRSLLVDAVAEVAAVAKALGIGLPDDIAATSVQAMGGFPPASRPSMQLDLDAGRPLELESLSGAVLRFGKKAGVPTPVHDVAYRALSRYLGGAPAGSTAGAP
ncbi:MAG: 2-dehydropantoate 2-reductase [Variovorax sp.]